MTKVTPFLMFNDQLEAAIAFYTTTFPDSEIKNVARTGKDGPITSAEFVIGGQSFMGYNGGPYFKFSSFCQMLWMGGERILHDHAAFFRSPSTSTAPAMSWSRSR